MIKQTTQTGGVVGSGVFVVWLWGWLVPSVPIQPEVAVVIGAAIVQPIADVLVALRDLLINKLRGSAQKELL